MKQFENIPAWGRYIAQDPDGSWWAYEAEPHIHDNGWYENEIGRLKKIAVNKPNKDWQSTLQQINSRHRDCSVPPPRL